MIFYPGVPRYVSCGNCTKSIWLHTTNMTITAETQTYDIKCDSWEDYVEALRNPGDGSYDGLPPAHA